MKIITNEQLKCITESQLKKILDNKFECYIIFAQEKEFTEAVVGIKGYSSNLLSLFKEGFRKYEPLKNIVGLLFKEEKTISEIFIENMHKKVKEENKGVKKRRKDDTT